MSAEFVHFEIAADDIEGLVEFYSKALGWVFRDPLPAAFGEYEGYRLFMTGEDEEESTGGGILQRGKPLESGVNYFEVEDLSEAGEKVKEAGGRVVIEEHTVPMVGRFIICEDPQGNRFGLWKQEAQP